MINNLKKKISQNKASICVIGLGYVGLPLADAFSQKFKVLGYDLSKKRINQLKKNIDINNINIHAKKIFSSNILFSYDKSELNKQDIFIITVPTPINKNNKPDLTSLDNVFSELLKLDLEKKCIIIESTVYPSLCSKYISIIENKKNFILNKDFIFGFSPERINPGDDKKNIYNISKIISGSSVQATELINSLYKKIIKKTHKTNVIEEAEMAKIIENTQRDINIAFINEISIICDKLNLNFTNVINLASTKWNFLKFHPGLVGGHCISVDPYYLTHKLNLLNYKPKVILSGRELNENYSNFIYKRLNKFKFGKTKNKVLIMGLSYKENCNDTRNSKSLDLAKIFLKNKYFVDLYDPHVKKVHDKNFKLIKKPKKNFYDLIIICVRHKLFFKNSIFSMKHAGNKNARIYDVKSAGFIK